MWRLDKCYSITRTGLHSRTQCGGPEVHTIKASYLSAHNGPTNTKSSTSVFAHRTPPPPLLSPLSPLAVAVVAVRASHGSRRYPPRAPTDPPLVGVAHRPRGPHRALQRRSHHSHRRDLLRQGTGTPCRALLSRLSSLRLTFKSGILGTDVPFLCCADGPKN
jgi:hypothetical protein